MQKQDMSAEDKILINCSKIDINGQTGDQTRMLLQKDLDWDYLLKRAIDNRVAPILYYSLEEQGIVDALPMMIRNKLREQFISSSFANQLLFRELKTVLKVLNDANITVVLLKGFMIAANIYPNMALRPVRDIDILVRKEDLAKAKERLAELGYAPTRYSNKNIEFENTSALVVEVHWDIVENYGKLLDIDVKELWARCEITRIDNFKTLVLSLEDLILHLCIHLSFNHYFYEIGLLHFCDIFHTIQKYKETIDWDDVAKNARKYGIGRFVYAALYLAKKVLEADVPIGILNLLHSDCSPAQLRWLEHRGKEDIIRRKLYAIHTPIVRLLWINSIRDKMKFLFMTLFPSPERLAMRYSLGPSSKLVYCYYLIRPIQLVQKFGRSSLRFVFEAVLVAACKNIFEMLIRSGKGQQEPRSF